jgi:hypothetical protein
MDMKATTLYFVLERPVGGKAWTHTEFNGTLHDRAVRSPFDSEAIANGYVSECKALYPAIEKTVVTVTVPHDITKPSADEQDDLGI